MARWMRVLEAFASQGEWGIRDLAAQTGLPRSTILRIVHEMTRLGLLTPASAPGRTTVGAALTRLAVRITDVVDVVRVARPALDELRDETGETAILALYDRTRRQFRAVTASEAPHPIRYIWESLTAWSELYLGASGRGILAFLPSDEQERILASLPDPVPGARPIPLAELRRELAEARARGWVISRGERVSGAVGVSAPIYDAGGRIIGEVLTGWPDNRTDAAKEALVAHATVRAAAHISGALGHRSWGNV